MIFCIGTTPAVQRVMVFKHLEPDAVNRTADIVEGAAGKSVNVAKAAALLGDSPLVTGFLGGTRGEFLRQELDARGVHHDFIPVASQTRLCITVIDQSSGTHTELVEESAPVAARDYEAFLQIVRRRMGACQAAVVSGASPAGAPRDLYRQCVQSARAAGKLIVLDAQGDLLREALAEGPDVVKPNRRELAATVGRPLDGEAAARRAMQDLHEQGAGRVVVTAGASPTLAFDGRRFWRISSPAVQVMNPIGSGDVFTATMTWRLLKGDDLGEACRWAAAAGSANALSLMPGEFNVRDLESLAAMISAEPCSI